MKKFSIYTTAALMALASNFAGCSSDGDGSVAGNSSEETGIIALENISIAGVARVGLILEDDQESDSVQREEPLITIFNNFDKGSVVTLHELDCKTFNETGRDYGGNVYDDEGAYKVDSITITCPYVLVEVSGKLNKGYYDDGRTASLRALVDLQTSKEVNVNVLTGLAVEGILKNVKAGSSFANAKKNAEQAVLKTFGIYDGLASFDSMDISGNTRSDGALYAVSYLLRNFLYYTQNVVYLSQNIASGEEWLDDSRMLQFVLQGGTYNKSTIGKGDLADMAIRARMYRWPNEWVAKYLQNYVLVGFDLDRCQESNQGTEVALKEYYVARCDSGLWLVKANYSNYDFGLSYTTGTMVDSRDSHEYKTVTYDVDGVVQTWMAENLNYAGVDSLLCPGGENANCDTYGPLYPLNVAMGISNTQKFPLGIIRFGSMENCLDEMKDGADSSEWRAHCEKYFDGTYLVVGGTYNRGEYAYGNLNRCVTDMEDSVSTEDAEDYCGVLFGELRDFGWFKAEEGGYAMFYAADEDSVYHLQPQGICPEGWRLPTDQDFKALEKWVGKSRFGVVMKSTTWPEAWVGGRLMLEGADAVGFNALPAGYAGEDICQFEECNLGKGATFALQGGSFYVISSDYAAGYARIGNIAVSVRCIKDSAEARE